MMLKDHRLMLHQIMEFVSVDRVLRRIAEELEQEALYCTTNSEPNKAARLRREKEIISRAANDIDRMGLE